MKTLAACLAAVGVAVAAATPASATPRSGPDPTVRASALGIRFVTRPLIARTLTNARKVHLPEPRYRRLFNDMSELKRWYDACKEQYG
jgi:hypothetical protein